MVRQPSTKRATILEVARLAGVSKATVARTFTGEAPVAEATRKAVLSAAQAVGYEPNLMASALRSGRTRTVGILWSLGRPESEGVVREIALRLAKREYVTLMADCLSDPAILSSTLAGFAGRGVEGIVLQADQDLLVHPEITCHFQKFKAVVAVTDKPLDTAIQPPVDVVARNTEHVIAEIVDHFVQGGRRRICLAGDLKANREKTVPFLRRLEHHGLSTRDALIPVNYPGHFFHVGASFRDAFDAYFQTHPLCDAILAVSTERAVAALLWLRERGISVPDQVAVCGGSDHDWLDAVAPPLAAIELHQVQAIEMISRLLLERMENPELPSRYELHELSFVWRESAGHAPTA